MFGISIETLMDTFSIQFESVFQREREREEKRRGRVSAAGGAAGFIGQCKNGGFVVNVIISALSFSVIVVAAAAASSPREESILCAVQ